jgi:O-acetyl-ADP-ribose deacetylase (regulator of RNase III)
MLKYKSGKIELIEGDVTKQEVDAIVNAANNALAPGGGVCGAIHRAAGPELATECATLGGADTGDAKITRGYNLPAKHVIHTPGPVWQGGDHGERELLASSYRRSMEIAAENGLKSIAFPSISTGIFGFPIESAAPIALRTAREFLETNPGFQVIRFVLWGEKDYNHFLNALKEMGESTGKG